MFAGSRRGLPAVRRLRAATARPLALALDAVGLVVRHSDAASAAGVLDRRGGIWNVQGSTTTAGSGATRIGASAWRHAEGRDPGRVTRTAFPL